MTSDNLHLSVPAYTLWLYLQVAVYHEVANNPFMLLNPQSKNVYLQLKVNRNDMINDTVLQLTSKNFQDYKKPLRVGEGK